MWHFAIGCYRPWAMTSDISASSYSVRVLCVCVSHNLSSAGRYCLDIFGASVPVIEAIDLIHGHDASDDAVFEDLLCLANSGRIGAALAAPYCSKHSRTTLRSPGPPPTACFLKVGFPIGHVRLIEDIISQPAVEKP